MIAVEYITAYRRAAIASERIPIDRQ